MTFRQAPHARLSSNSLPFTMGKTPAFSVESPSSDSVSGRYIFAVTRSPTLELGIAMRSLRIRAVVAFGRALGVPVAIHQSFFANGKSLNRSPSVIAPTARADLKFGIPTSARSRSGSNALATVCATSSMLNADSNR